MKRQKISLCVAALLATFGASLGLFELGNYLRAAFQPLKLEFKLPEPITPPVYAPPRPAEVKLPVFTPTEETKPEEETENWGESGYYYILDDNPKGFADFEWLELVTDKYEQKLGKVVAVKPKGWINTGYSQPLLSVNMTGKRITLVSEKQKGISYRFDGKFVKEEIKYKDEDGEEQTSNVALKGRLTKWRNGVKIAEANVKFGFTVGC